MEHCLLSSNNSINQNNTQNGGLILDTDRKQFLCSMPDNSGTYIIDKHDGRASRIEDLMWFANSYGKYIYYSNQKYSNKMFRLDTETNKSEQFLDIPSFQPIIIDNDIFLINEEDKKLYSYNLTNNSRTKILDCPINSFLLHNNRIIYNNDNEIASCSLGGKDREVLLGTAALRLIIRDNAIIFADKNNKYILTELNLLNGQKYAYEDISTIGYTSDGRYIYVTNISNGSSIYRIDNESKSCFRIYGESADYLHIVKQELYFLSNDNWNRMDLAGGQALKIDINRDA